MSRIAFTLDSQQKDELRQITATLLKLRFEHQNRSLKDITQLKKIRRQRAQLLTRGRLSSKV